MTQAPVAIRAVWIRRIGNYAELLVELSDGWHLCARDQFDGNFSHIVEPAGILASPQDEVTWRGATRHD